MSIDSTRLRRFARTFSSWPEYACTTYQRASLAETALLTTMFILPRRLRRHSWGDGWSHGRRGGDHRGGGRDRCRGRGLHLLRDGLVHAEAQQVVRPTDQDGEDDHGCDDNAGHTHQLVARRPDDLLELLPDAAEVGDGASPPRSTGPCAGQ